MTVVFNKAGEQRFTANDVLWSKRELVNAMVEAALVGQTEGFIEMIADGERSEDITRASVNETLRGVKDSTQDFLNDMIADLQRALDKRLAEVNYGAAVTGIKYDLAGNVIDIEVDVSVGTE
jgi:hypothetical protein